MIEHLSVTNVALIAQANVAFGPGLNIISGETGAGKSMLLGALAFVLGGRATKDFIRNGEESAQVDALFSVSRKDTAKALVALEVSVQDGQVLLSRMMAKNGKTVCKINGKMVTVGMMRDVSSLLVDTHSQHASQSLLDSVKQLKLLDAFCDPALETRKQALLTSIRAYKDVTKQIQALPSGDATERAGKTDLLTFQLNEIEAAKLSEGEEERLLARRKNLAHVQKLTGNAFTALALLSEGDSGETAATGQIARAARLLAEIGDIDNTQAYLAENVQSLLLQLSDTARDLRQYAESLEHDPEALEQIEKRLDLIHSLKRKYGEDVTAILAHGENVRRQLHIIENSEADLKALLAKRKVCSAELTAHCAALSALRQQAAKHIAAQIAAALVDLGMKDARFDISLERKPAFSASGYDNAQFLIAPNLGEPLKPLAAIASGGEMSRVMLALKAVLADADPIETFIFDEIDAGTSGKTAQKVGEKLKKLAQNHQILCITHLPQIAALADIHLLIEKQTQDGRTATHIMPLDINQSIRELARLIGGAEITEATMRAAGELKEMAMRQP